MSFDQSCSLFVLFGFAFHTDDDTEQEESEENCDAKVTVGHKLVVVVFGLVFMVYIWNNVIVWNFGVDVVILNDVGTFSGVVILRNVVILYGVATFGDVVILSDVVNSFITLR